jgi:hypothetical protein
MTRKLIDEYDLWGLKLNIKKTKYMAIWGTSRDLQLEDGKGIIIHVNEYTYLGVRITKDGNNEPEINDRINIGRSAITFPLYSVLILPSICSVSSLRGYIPARIGWNRQDTNAKVCAKVFSEVATREIEMETGVRCWNGYKGVRQFVRIAG